MSSLQQEYTKDQLWTYADFTLAYLHRMNITILLNLLELELDKEIQQQQQQFEVK